MGWDWDFEDDDDELDSLENLFDDLEIESPTKEQLYKMYGVFLEDIVRNPILIDGKSLNYNNSKSSHPLCRGKMKSFEHLITRESKLKGKRIFDRERANKIHWIKPIILNKNDTRIKYFERVNDEGFNQLYYWYEDKGFVVIIRELNPNILIITAFSVDTLNKFKYKKHYEAYNQNG